MFLRQSTASQTRLTPRFVDDTDFKTPETGLTIANTDVKLSKNGAASANKNSGGGTHIEAGRYALTFDATDTATVGELSVGIVISGALPVEFKYFVVEEAVYDALFVAAAPGYVVDQPVNTTKVGGTSQTAGDLKAALNLLQADTDDIQTRIPAALAADGSIKASLSAILGTAFTEDSGGLIAAAFKKFFNKATPTGTINSIPDAVAGAASGIAIVGSNMGTVSSVTGAVGSLAAQAKADVNAEVVDAIAVDTYAEPAQGAPAATTTLAVKIGFLYKAWRNKKTQTATTLSLFNDDAATVDHKATVSDDGTTATVGEVATGP